MEYVTIYAIVPTVRVDHAVMHSPYRVAGIVPISEGMTYRDLHQALDDALAAEVDDGLIHSLVRELMFEDSRADVNWGSDVYELGPFDETYSIIVTGEW